MEATSTQALALIVIGYLICARRITILLNHSFAGDGVSKLSLTLTYIISLTLVATAAGARLQKSFTAGMWTTAIAVITLALVLLLIRTKQEYIRRSHRYLAGSCLATILVLITHAALLFQHSTIDSSGIFVNQTIITQLSKDFYPPFPPPLPLSEIPSHHGFELLVALISKLSNLPHIYSYNILCLFLLFILCMITAAIANDTGAHKHQAWAIIVMYFGAGLALVGLDEPANEDPLCMAQHSKSVCGYPLLDTQAINLLKPDLLLGLCLMFSYFLLVTRVAGLPRSSNIKLFNKNWFVLATLCILSLAALGISQASIHSLAVSSTLVAVGAWAFRHSHWQVALKSIFAVLLIVASGHILTHFLVGTFDASPIMGDHLIGSRPTMGWPNKKDLTDILKTYILNIGLPFALIPFFAAIALFGQRPLILPLTLTSVAGLLVPQFYTYERSPTTILEFVQVTTYILGILYIVVVDRRLHIRGSIDVGFQRVGRVLIIGGGILALTLGIFKPLTKYQLLDNKPAIELSTQAKSLLEFFEDNKLSTSKKLIFTSYEKAVMLSNHGGHAVLAVDSNFQETGIANNILWELRQDIHKLSSTLETSLLEKHNVGWIVLDQQEYGALEAKVQKQLQELSPPFTKKLTVGANTSDQILIWVIEP